MFFVSLFCNLQLFRLAPKGSVKVFGECIDTQAHAYTKRQSFILTNSLSLILTLIQPQTNHKNYIISSNSFNKAVDKFQWKRRTALCLTTFLHQMVLGLSIKSNISVQNMVSSPKTNSEFRIWILLSHSLWKDIKVLKIFARKPEICSFTL